jgi:hypothetical protein
MMTNHNTAETVIAFRIVLVLSGWKYASRAQGGFYFLMPLALISPTPRPSPCFGALMSIYTTSRGPRFGTPPSPARRGTSRTR